METEERKKREGGEAEGMRVTQSGRAGESETEGEVGAECGGDGEENGMSEVGDAADPPV